MALYKEIISDNGVVSKYFRINNIILNIDDKKISISIKEYADDLYREKEKEITNLHNAISTKQFSINSLNEDYKNNEEEIIKQNQELMVLVKELNNLMAINYFIGERQYDFEFEDKNYSISDCYNLLKQLDEFKDSTDV